MTALTGEIQTYLDALGTEDGSEEMLAAMRLVGTNFTMQEFTSAGIHERFLEFRRGGVEMMVIDGILETIFFQLPAPSSQLAESEEEAAYPRPGALIPGLHHGMSRQAAIEQLGPPLRDEPGYLRFAIGDAFAVLHLQEGGVAQLTLQLEAPGADAPPVGEEPSSAAAPAPLTGEITRFIEIVGSREGVRASAEIIADFGPHIDSHPLEDEHGSGVFVALTDGGVDLQYRNDTVEGALIHTSDRERTPYPRLGALVEGLAFPATRVDVRDALGAAETPRADIDLYHAQGRHVLFSYTSDELTTISIVVVPALREVVTRMNEH